MLSVPFALSLVVATTPVEHGDATPLAPSTPTSAHSSLPRAIVPGRALVQRGADVSFSELGVTLVRELRFGWALVALPSAGTLDEEQTAAAIAALRRDPRVVGAAPDRWFTPALVPQDPLLEQQWPLESAGLFSAWNETTGNESQLIGIVDTGTFTAHPDLAGRDVLGYDFISDVALSFDGDGRDGDYTDPGLPTACGDVALNLTTHGTHIAGIVAANADGAGMVGLNFAAGLVTARAMNACGGAESDLLDALAWLGGLRVEGTPVLGRAVDVINLSLGAQGSCAGALQSYVTQLHEESGVIVVAAAGNDGNGSAVRVPASCEHVIAVGAHGRSAGWPLSPYSNTAGIVDIIAPGGDRASDPQDAILSLCGAGADCYQFAQGTSMATAFVSGAVSLVLAAYPGIDRTRVLEVLRQSGQPCAGCGDVPALRVDTALTLAATIPSGVPQSSPCDEGLCGPGGQCGEDQRCLTVGGTSCCYSRCEAPVIGTCGEGRRCALVEGGNVCVAAGDLHEGSPCDPSASACRDGHVCGTSNGESQCIRLCGPSGGVCRSTSQSCREAGD
ncbi:MAG: S8 family serine peptidase, partial [Myxococcota bacterium]